MDIKKFTITALFVAIGVLAANLLYIPVGVAKCLPVQSAINILLAVFLGSRYAVSAAFGISLLRNILHTGSLLAFPGSMFGAALAGFLYRRTKHIFGAMIGEILGTGMLGAMAAFPLAKFLLGSEVGAFFYVMPFFISAVGGSIVAYLLYHTPLAALLREKLGLRAG